MSQDNSFAAAVKPVSISTVVHTDRAGLITGRLSIPASDGQALPIYYARPDSIGPQPVVLVVQEIFGLHEHIQDVVRRLAKLGYFALAPDLYFRHGDATKIDNIDRLRAEIVSQVSDAQVLSDLDHTANWAGINGGDLDRLGLTGFCWGGRIAWLYAAHQSRLKAAVAWYGRFEGESSALTPRHPIDVLAELKAPVLGLYGGQDAGIPVASVARVREALESLGSVSRVDLYPDAPHAFYADYRPSFRAIEAADGWRQLQAWFKGAGL